MTTRRARNSFRPTLDTLPSRLTPGTYPSLGPMPSDPVGTGTAITDTPNPILLQPGSPDNDCPLTVLQLKQLALLN